MSWFKEEKSMIKKGWEFFCEWFFVPLLLLFLLFVFITILMAQVEEDAQLYKCGTLYVYGESLSSRNLLVPTQFPPNGNKKIIQCKKAK